jgi:hypothetical protein
MYYSFQGLVLVVVTSHIEVETNSSEQFVQRKALVCPPYEALNLLIMDEESSSLGDDALRNFTYLIREKIEGSKRRSSDRPDKTDNSGPRRWRGKWRPSTSSRGVQRVRAG